MNNQMNTLQATNYLRPLNRRTAEHLILATDGNCYSVDFDEKWGSESTLLNALGSRLCQVLEIEAAGPVLIRINPEVLELGVRGTPPDAEGVFLGKRYPVDPAASAIYDFIPDSLLPKVENRGDFWKLIPIDLWLGNPQASRALFYRTVPQMQLFRSAIVFRTFNESVLQLRPCRTPIKLPLHGVRHYCDVGGSENAERTATQLFAMNASEIEGLLDGLPGDPIDRRVAIAGSVAKALVAARDTRFSDYSAKLLDLQHRVDSAGNDRKPPHTEVACADVAGALNEKLSTIA